MNYLKVKIAIIINTFITFIIIHNVIPNNNLNIIYCKDLIILLPILNIKLIRYHQHTRQSRTGQNLSKAFLSQPIEKCIL